MDKNMYDFLIIGSVGILFIFCIGIGINRMTKIIIGSYILIATSLAIFSLLDFLTTSLMGFKLPFIDYDISPILNFINNYKQYINIFLYFILFALIFVKFSIIQLEAKNMGLRIVFYILLTPLTVMSIVSSLLVSVFGTDVIDNDKLIKFVHQFEVADNTGDVQSIGSNTTSMQSYSGDTSLPAQTQEAQNEKRKKSFIYYFFRLTPVWIILPGFFILLISVFLGGVKVGNK